MHPKPETTAPLAHATAKKSALLIGIEPTLIDFSSPDYAAFPGLTAAKVLEGFAEGIAGVQAVGYDAQQCLIDLGETAEAVLTALLQQQHFDCILIGAGVRTVPSYFMLFEKLINVVHQHAPHSKICFNTRPSDSWESLQRWM
jgi:hypothetical protein